LDEAFADERSFCIETPRGIRMSLPVIPTQPTWFQRLMRWLRRAK
jgi:hypothetical protein